MNSAPYNSRTYTTMEEKNATLTTFNLGLPGEEFNRDGILSKLYGKVKLAVSKVDCDKFEDLNATHDNKKNSWYLCPTESQGTLTDTSEISLVATNSSHIGQFTLPASGSMDSLTTLQSPRSLMNYSSSALDSTYTRSSSTAKAPPIASVFITTATATKQNSAKTSSTCSVDETSSTNTSNNNSKNRSYLLESFDNDNAHFLPHNIPQNNKTAIPINDLTFLGNNLSLPMVKSQSVDSDTQSVATNFSISNTNSLGKTLTRLRGQKSNKEYWMPDEQCKECYKCRKQFTVFRRKHHCRLCGQIFCSKCVSRIIPGNSYNQRGQVRICNFCYSEQHLNNNGDISSLSATPSSRLHPLLPSTYDLSDSDDNDYNTCAPVIPCQNPPLVAPMMQIPTTAVKKPSSTQYGDTNSTTVALELSDHTALLDDGRNYQLSRRKSTVIPVDSSPGSSPHGNSFLATDGLELGGLKRLLNAGTSILNSRSRSSISAPTSTDISQRGLNDGSYGRHVDHGGGTAVTENELSPFFSGNGDGGQDIGTVGDYSNKIRDIRHRSVSCLTHTPPYPLQHSKVLRHGRSTSTSVGQLTLDPVAESDNESYDGHRWARASRGTLAPLSRQSTTNSVGRKDRRGQLQVNTSGLMKSDSLALDSCYPSPCSHHGSRLHSDSLYSLSSPISPLPTSTSMASTPTLCDNTVDQQGIKTKLLKIRNRRVSTSLTNTDLSYSALGHAQKLLRQLIDETSLRGLTDTDKSHWENVIMNLLLKLTDHVQPDVRAGDDMDLRHYIKIKKIPGGSPSDSFYVRGVMCSKNVAHKRMAKNLTEPRILILLFSLDYSRVEMENQLLSIQPVISQEREHINNLVGRIIALKPSLLLVKSTVSRLALEMLLEANIPVVHNVKYSAIEAVARCTQASVVTSVDKLHGDLFFGHCGSFEIRTFLHEWIPHRRKTLLIFDDCAPELGGTIVLRGGTVETLKTIKMVMDFMVYVVNNLKLETSLLRDSFAKNRGLDKSQIMVADATMEAETKQEMGQPGHGSDALHAFLKMYRDTILSTSQYVVFPPPYLLTRLKETEDQLNALEKESLTCAPHHDSRNTTVTITPNCSTVGLHPGDNSSRVDGSLSLPLAVFSPSSDIIGSRYELLEAQKHRLNCAWEAYLRESPDYVSPFYHQNIVVLYSNVCTETTMPCCGPEIRVFEYYRQPSDITLGQYLLDLFADALEPCASAMCDYPVMNHYLSYAHGDARINVITQRFECPISGMSDKLLTWSYCKICKKATQVTRVSDCTWNYSFGKFLELFLYQQGVYCRADLCPHEMGRHHVRFFGYMNLSVGFQYESIGLLEVAVPPTKLFMLSQVHIALKDDELNLLRTKITQFYDSIIERNKAFPYDLVEPQNLDEIKADLEDLSDRATGSKKKVLQILQNIYATTAKNDTLTINWVRRILYQEVTEWDMEYTDLVRYYLLPERELLKITTSQLRKMFPADTATPQPSSVSEYPTYSCVDLSLLGFASDEKGGLMVVDNDLNLSVDSPMILPYLFDSPSTSPGSTYNMEPTDTPGSETKSSSLLRPSIQRKLSLELNRELQLRFRVSDSKEEQPQPPSYYPQTRTPGPTAAALTPSRIPMPNINITSTSRSLLSPPIYDTLRVSPINSRLILPSGSNRIPMAPLKVPSSLELNVATPGLHLIPSKENMSLRKGKRLFGPSELRLSLPTAPGGISQSTNDSTPTFVQQKQRQTNYRSGLHTQSLQHMPTMFRSQYSNNELGRRAVGGIQRRTTAPTSNGITTPSTFGKPGIRHQGQFKSRLPRRKTHIQVYTQANDLVKEDMDDEFLINDLDDGVDPGTNNDSTDSIKTSDKTIELDKARYSKGVSNMSINGNTKTHLDEGNRKRPISNAGKRTPLLLSMPKPEKNLEKLAEMNNLPKKLQEEPIDYFSPQAPYTGTSGVTPTTTLDQDRINQSVAAAMASVPRTPFSIQSIISATTSRRSSSMLERIDTTPSTDSGTSTSLHENQLPLASDLLSSPAAISTSDSLTSFGQKETTEHHKIAGLPRNALIDRPARRAVDLDEVKQVEKTSFVKTITNFLTDTGTANLLPLNNPLNPVEHVMPDSFVIVREDEPSTIIAYTLSCDDYLKKMKEIRVTTATVDTNSSSGDTNTTIEPLDDTHLDPSMTAPFSLDTEINQTYIQDTLLQEYGNHMRYNFSDGNTKFFCKTFFTEQFDALRRQCGCDKSYILSLAGCVKWDAVGGKSGSAFLKTKDDRFLMKQMSRFELDAFLGFAPAYFQYLSKAFFKELPTVLAKIFGFYSIGYKNSSTGKSMRMDVLVMENLFYQRNVKKIFDLKGSMRNRHVESTGKEDEVLLDENLVELIFQSPLFIRAHSKDILRSSLHNDTLFLSGSNVMDYSLLVGIDEECHELVVGIVDFIRTFTWDKKLESWVKESVFLGPGVKEPTIISPRQYRLRFRAAMERYFLMVPDVWALAKKNRLPPPSSSD